MSGHSKFHNIQKTKNKEDAKRSQIFTKISRELSVAVKAGGADPNTNSKLFDVIAKARDNNMPNENITRVIKKASGEGNTDNYESVIYEGYGVGGVAFVVDCLTDNRNRTAGDVRHLFDRNGGNLGTSGSVLYLFSQKGVIVVPKNSELTEELAYEIALEAEADDMVVEDEVYIYYTTVSTFKKVKEYLENKHIDIFEANIEYVPATCISVPESQQTRLENLVDALESLDDVQNVYHNGDF